jgi:N-acetylmuramoyl-L-alanine amidase
MIRAPKCPAVLLEMGFMTNKTDAQKLQDPMTQIRIAERISDTMAEFTEYMEQ